MGLQNISKLLTTSLARTNFNTSILTQQIASGNRLIRPSLDPGAFVASQRVFSQLGSLDAVNSSITRGRSLLSVAESGLGDVGDQLNDVRRLTLQSFNAVGSDRDAIQGAINTTIDQIERNLSGTRFAGQPLADSAFRTTDDSADVLSQVEFTRSPNPVGGGIDVDVEIASAGSEAQTTVTGAAALSAGGDVEIEVRGSNGRAEIRVAQGSSAEQFAASINAQTERTGVRASVNGADVELRSLDAGSSQRISLGDLNASGVSGTGAFSGSDADVTVNGVQARADGNSVRFDANGLVGSFNVDATTPAATSTSLQIVGGGVTLPIDANGRTATFGLPAFSGNIGRSSGVGSLADLQSGGRLSNGSLGDRLAVLDSARDEVLSSRVNLAVADSGLGSAQAATQSSIQELSAAFADLSSTDFAAAATDLQRTSFQRQLQISLLRESNLSQAGVLRLLEN